jgi:hypothetical protein
MDVVMVVVVVVAVESVRTHRNGRIDFVLSFCRSLI